MATPLRIVFSLALVLLIGAGSAEQQCLAADRTSRPKVALILGGGGVRGAAHVGVLKVFEQAGIKPDLVIGSSTGALVGGWYCAGVKPEKMESWMLDGTVRKALLPRPLWLAATLRTLDSALFSWRSRFYPGVFSGNGIAGLVRKTVGPEYRQMEALPVPFATVATNLVNGQPEKLSEGDLGKAIQASLAWTPLYKPVVLGNGVYADGGLSLNLPSAWAHEAGAGVVIVVNVDEELRNIEPRTLKSLTGLASRMSTIMVTRMDQYLLNDDDLVIAPDVTGILLIDTNTDSLRKAIAAGERAATEALPEIKRRLKVTGLTLR